MCTNVQSASKLSALMCDYETSTSGGGTCEAVGWNPFTNRCERAENSNGNQLDRALLSRVKESSRRNNANGGGNGTGNKVGRAPVVEAAKECVTMATSAQRASLRASGGGVDDNFLSASVHFANKRLCYSNQHCSRIPEVIIKLYGEKTHSMDLSYNDLITTRGLERFLHLRELVLDNNQLGDTIGIPYLPHLHTLSLNKNLINDIELLLDKLTCSLPALTFLSLLGNKACPNQLSDMSNDDDDYMRYRFYVISRLPHLEFLDSTRVSPKERQLASAKGQFMRVVRPKEEDTGDGNSRGSTQDDSPPGAYYSPLPRTMRRPDDHKGAYSRCKYKYSGKHSEGNRFISNNDL